MSLGQYILDADKNPVPCNDTLTWAKWMEWADNRRVARTEINGYTISTVFLALDHNFSGGPPLLFETMIIKASGEFLDYQERYSTWKEAIDGHNQACYAAETNPEYLETGEIE